MSQVAMSDRYLYWVHTRPPGCSGCDQLWRTRLSDGARSPALPARKGSILKLTARGSWAAITEISKSPRRYLSRVRLVNEAGSVRQLAKATYRIDALRHCGSMVGAGELSAAGELAWQMIEVPRAWRNCKELPDNVRWSAFAGSFKTAGRQILRPRKQQSILLFHSEALQQIRPILGFDGARLLTRPDSEAINVLDVSTGKMLSYSLKSNADNSSTGDLGPSGQVVTAFISHASGDRFIPVLFPRPMSLARPINLTVDGAEVLATRFCGSSLIQIAENKDSITVLRRDFAGTIQHSTTFAPAADWDISWFDCNGSTGALYYYVLGRRDEPDRPDEIVGQGAFTFELP